MLNPDVWNGIGVVGFLVVAAGAVFWGLEQGWMSLGVHHREIVAAKDETISELREGQRRDSEIVLKLATTVSDWDAAAKLQTHILESIRDSTGRGHP